MTAAQAAATFALNSSFDPERYGKIFAAQRRVRIAPFLAAESAEALAAHLAQRQDWRLVLNAGEKVFELDRGGQKQLSDAQRRALDEKVVQAARAGFQYRFESIRVSDIGTDRMAAATMLDRFAEFMASAPVLSKLRSVTGLDGVRFADAQATRYGAGHFLTRHDDDVAGKNRLAAYVCGLTGGWNADWGGLLLFQEEGADIAEARVPSFNTLDIFAVPQAHSVTMVAPFADRDRLSVTGWLRSALPAASSG